MGVVVDEFEFEPEPVVDPLPEADVVVDPPMVAIPPLLAPPEVDEANALELEELSERVSLDEDEEDEELRVPVLDVSDVLLAVICVGK